MIVPIQKNAHPEVMNEFCPVALTSVPIKCLEKIVKNRLTNEVKGSFDEYQFAYRPRRKTEDAILTLIDGICEHLEKTKAFAKVVFEDFASAFSTILPYSMVQKLLNLNVNSNIIRWVNNSLAHTGQQVRLNSTLSTLCYISTGAPQGCVLSPILYTLYTNECRSLNTNHNLIKYADDTALVGIYLQKGLT